MNVVVVGGRILYLFNLNADIFSHFIVGVWNKLRTTNYIAVKFSCPHGSEEVLCSGQRSLSRCI